MTARRGMVMLEIVVSIALFVAAAGLTLAISRDVLGALDRVTREQEAVDLAASRMAELEAGLIALADLREGGASELDYPDDPASRWALEVSTERTAWRDLTLVQITVREADREDDGAVSFTLRQLLRLRDGGDEAYRLDELMEDLP